MIRLLKLVDLLFSEKGIDLVLTTSIIVCLLNLIVSIFFIFAERLTVNFSYELYSYILAIQFIAIFYISNKYDIRFMRWLERKI